MLNLSVEPAEVLQELLHFPAENWLSFLVESEQEAGQEDLKKKWSEHQLSPFLTVTHRGQRFSQPPVQLCLGEEFL